MKLTGVEKLISSIIEEAQEEAEGTLAEANQKAEKLKQEINKAAEHNVKETLDNAHKNGTEKKKRMLAVYGLELRKELLTVKREALNEAYEKALIKLSQLNKEEYLALVKKLLLKIVSTGTESVSVSSEEKYIDAAFLDTVNAELKASGKAGDLKMSREKANIKNGFVLKQCGLIIDCSFDTLIKELRDSTESQVAQILFG